MGRGMLNHVAAGGTPPVVVAQGIVPGVKAIKLPPPPLVEVCLKNGKERYSGFGTHYFGRGKMVACKKGQVRRRKQQVRRRK